MLLNIEDHRDLHVCGAKINSKIAAVIIDYLRQRPNSLNWKFDKCWNYALDRILLV